MLYAPSSQPLPVHHSTAEIEGAEPDLLHFHLADEALQVTPGSAKAVESRDGVTNIGPNPDVQRHVPPGAPLESRCYDSPALLRMLEDIFEGIARLKEVMRETEEDRVRMARDAGLLDRRFNKSDVPPSVRLDSPAGYHQHFRALVDADDPSLSSDAFFDEREAEPSAATHVEDDVAGVQVQKADSPAASALNCRDLSLIIRCSGLSVLLQRKPPVGWHLHLAGAVRKPADARDPLLQLLLPVQVVEPLGGADPLLLPRLVVAPVHAHEGDRGGGGDDGRHAGAEPLRLVDADVGDGAIGQELEGALLVAL